MPASYDRRHAKVAVKKKQKLPIVPRGDQAEVLKHLTAAHYILQEWVIHSNPESALHEEYEGQPGHNYEKLAKIRDQLDELTTLIRRL